eukprot:m.26923 g.26923  ORF g.26923 m.26923 type:complete len:322 (-) comp11594_c0_seq3:24-989(-)
MQSELSTNRKNRAGRKDRTQQHTCVAMSSRPEHIAPPEVFYNAEEAKKYTCNSHIIEVQGSLTRRCLELLNLPDGQPCLILDVGCGSGLSGEEITDAGHEWIGVDISKDMLDVAREREVDGDLQQLDMGDGVCFRPGCFDGVISVSALQWLCNADKSSHDPRKRMSRFFTTLYGCLARGARAVFQFYPETPDQMFLLTKQALRAGFSGGIVIDYPNSTRAKKVFLCLFAGVAAALPQGKEGNPDDEDAEDDDDGSEAGAATEASFVAATKKAVRRTKKGDRTPLKGKDWIKAKKERRRRQMGDFEVRPDTKYTGRRRKAKF